MHEVDGNRRLVRLLLRELGRPASRRTAADRVAGASSSCAVTRTGLCRRLAFDRAVLLQPGSLGSSRRLAGRTDARNSPIASAMPTASACSSTSAPANSALADFSGHEIIGKDLDLVQLLAIVAKADAVVSNSTGPLHGGGHRLPVVGLYPPVGGCTPDRWGPMGRRPPGARRARGGSLIGPTPPGDIMNGIAVETVVEAVEALLFTRAKRRRGVVFIPY